MKLAYRLPKGALKKLSNATSIETVTLSRYISRTHGISIAKAQELGDICIAVGLNITREEWAFAKENDLKIKINDWFKKGIKKGDSSISTTS